MADRQIVTKGQGQLTSTTRLDTNIAEWQIDLEQSLFAHLHRMTMEPDFLLDIEQKTEACFNLLMQEGLQQLEQHAANLSATADNELAVFKDKAGMHLEERIQLASTATLAQASAHAKRLQDDTEFQMNQHLQGLITEAKDTAAQYAVAEVQSTLHRAEGHIDHRATLAIQDMIQRFDGEARARFIKLLDETYSSARAELQTVTDSHMIDIRRRVNEEIDGIVRQIHRKEERVALSAIQTQAAEETRILTATIGSKLDAVFREVHQHQASALKALDERAGAHASIVQQTIQRQVRIAWEQSEAKIRGAISKEVATRLCDHAREMGEDVDERVRAALRGLKREEAIASVVKAFVQQETTDQYKQHENQIKAEILRGLQQLEKKVEVLIADAAAKPVEAGTQQDVELQFQSVKKDIREAVQDLDEKIAQVSRSIAVANPALRAEAASIENENLMALVRTELHEALAAIDKKIKDAAHVSVSADANAAVTDDKEALETAMATRIQREVQTAVGAIDARLQAELRRSIGSRLPPMAADSIMQSHEQDLALVRRDFEAAIRGVESKISRAEDRSTLGTTASLSPPRGLNASIVMGSGASQHEIVIRCRTEADIPQTSAGLQVASTSTLIGAPKLSLTALERLEVESRAIERAMQNAWDDAVDDSDGPEEPTELRALTPHRIEAFLRQFEAYKTAGGSRAWTAFVRPGLLAFVRSCELAEDASDSDIFGYLQRQVNTSKSSGIAEFVKLFDSVVADADATTLVEKVQSVLMGMEEILAQRECDGHATAVPMRAYGRIALSKLPGVFKAHEAMFDLLTTKREIKGELLKLAAQLE